MSQKEPLHWSKQMKVVNDNVDQGDVAVNSVLECTYVVSLVGTLGLCVKGIEFRHDISSSMLEWLLLSKEQGYGMIYLYLYKKLHPKTTAVLRYHARKSLEGLMHHPIVTLKRLALLVPKICGTQALC